MTNPYQPPQGPTENRLKRLLAPSTYVGGKVSIVLLGVAAGTIAAVLIHRYLDFKTNNIFPFILTFAAPAIVWIGTMFALMLMLRGAQVHVAKKIWLSLLMAIPAYILYVPVCTYGSVFTTEFMGSSERTAMILVSVTTFVVILLIVAAILRRCLKQPVIMDDSDIVSTTPAGVVAPLDEQTHE